MISSAFTTAVVLLLCNSLYFATTMIISSLWFFYLSAGETCNRLLFNVFTFIPPQRSSTSLSLLFWSVFLISSDVLLTWRGMMLGYLFLARLTEHLKSGILFWDELCKFGKAEVVLKACLGFFCGGLQILYLISLTEAEMSPLSTHPLIQTVMRHSSESTREHVFSYPSLDAMLREEKQGGESREHEGLRLLALVAISSTVIEIFFVMVTVALLLGGFSLCERAWGVWRNPLSEGLHHTFLDPRSERVFFIPNLVKQLFCALFCFWFLLSRSNAFLLQCVLGISTYFFCDGWTLLQTERDALSGIPFCVVTDSETSCCICMDEIPLSHVARRLPCGHLFHSACLRKWIVRHRDCPLCRGRTTVDGALAPRSRVFRSHDTSTERSSEEDPLLTSEATAPTIPMTVRARRLYRVPALLRQQVADASYGHPPPSLSSSPSSSSSVPTIDPSISTSMTLRHRGSRLQNIPLPSTITRQTLAPSHSSPFLPEEDGTPAPPPLPDVLPTAMSSTNPEETQVALNENVAVSANEAEETTILMPSALEMVNRARWIAPRLRMFSFLTGETGVNHESSSGSSSSSSGSSSSESDENTTVVHNDDTEASTLSTTVVHTSKSSSPHLQTSNNMDDVVEHPEKTEGRSIENCVTHRSRSPHNESSSKESLNASSRDSGEQERTEERESKVSKIGKPMRKKRKKQAVETLEMTTFEDVSLLQSSSSSVVTSTKRETDIRNLSDSPVVCLPKSAERKRPRSGSSSPMNATVPATVMIDEAPQSRRRRKSQ